MRVKLLISLVVVSGIVLLAIANRALTQPGRGGSSGGGTPGGRGGFDPNQRFDQYANGRNFFLISEMTDPWRKERLTQFAQQNGITDGRITREQYMAYSQQSFGGGSRGPSGSSAGIPGSSSGFQGSSGGFRGSSGGFAGTPGGPPTSQGGFPSAPGGFPSGGTPGGGMGFSDPNDIFNRMSGGRDVVRRGDLTDPRMQYLFDAMASQLGATNGEITRQQFQGGAQQFMAMRSMGGGGSPSGPGGNTDGWAESDFRRRDRNGDGLLNYDEMSDTLKGERDKWDGNGDGFIDLNEFKGYMQGRMQRRMEERGGQVGDQPGSGQGFPEWMPVPEMPAEDLDRKPVVYRAGKLPQGLPSWFRELDSDTDAQVGLYEWKHSSRPFEEFDRIDRNGDGFLTVEETLRFVSVQQESGSSRSGDLMAGGFGRGSGGPPGGGTFGRGSGGPPGGSGRGGPPGGSGRGGPPGSSSGESSRSPGGRPGR